MPGFPFPRVGPWDCGSPPSSSDFTLKFGTMVSYDCPVLFSVASVCPRAPIPDRLPFLCVPEASPTSRLRLIGQAEHPFQCQGPWSTGTPPLPVYFHQETRGSPEFPNCPYEPMPRSQTPVVSYPLALACVGLLPFAWKIASALGCGPLHPYPIDHHNRFFEVL